MADKAGLTDAGRVSTRLIRLSRMPNGGLSKSPLLAAALRGALLIDLALAEALVNTPTGLEVDTTPTGYPPADRLLAAVVRHPDHTMEWWLRRGPDCVEDVVAELLRTGAWARQHGPLGRRYDEHDPVSLQGEGRRVRDALAGHADSPQTAALATIAGLVGLGMPAGQHPDATLLLSCAPAGWLMSDVVVYLLDRRALLLASAADAQASLSANFIF